MIQEKTNNIYSSWIETIGTPKMDKTIRLRQLNDLNHGELLHVQWLIEQELKARNNTDVSRCEHVST